MALVYKEVEGIKYTLSDDLVMYVTGEGVVDVGSAFPHGSGVVDATLGLVIDVVGSVAIKSCDHMLNLRHVEIMDGVTDIGGMAFLCCESLESVSLPSSISAVAHATFLGCCSLKDVDIPDGVLAIWDYAFADCVELTIVSGCRGINMVGTCAFSNCTSLKEFTLYDSAFGVEHGAFDRCYALEKFMCPKHCVILPGSFTSSSRTRVILSGVDTAIEDVLRTSEVVGNLIDWKELFGGGSV